MGRAKRKRKTKMAKKRSKKLAKIYTWAEETAKFFELTGDQIKKQDKIIRNEGV